LIASQFFRRYEDETKTVFLRFRYGIIDQDTGEIIWADSDAMDAYDQRREMKSLELHDRDASWWNMRVEDIRSQAEREGKRFIIVSDWEIIVEDALIPGRKKMHRYNDETNTYTSH